MGGPPPARGGGGGGGGGYGGPPRSMNGGGNFPRANPWAVNGEGSLMNQQPAPPMLSPPGGPGVIGGGPGGPGKGSTQVTIPKDVSEKSIFFYSTG